LDPDFAMAYSTLGTAYSNQRELAKAEANTTKAYSLRHRVSEREKFYIDSHYYDFALNNADKAMQTYLLWEQTYPRDTIPLTNLAGIYLDQGESEKARAQVLASIAIEPGNAADMLNLGVTYMNESRFPEAESVFKEAIKKYPGTPDFTML